MEDWTGRGGGSSGRESSSVLAIFFISIHFSRQPLSMTFIDHSDQFYISIAATAISPARLFIHTADEYVEKRFATLSIIIKSKLWCCGS